MGEEGLQGRKKSGKITEKYRENSGTIAAKASNTGPRCTWERAMISYSAPRWAIAYAEFATKFAKRISEWAIFVRFV